MGGLLAFRVGNYDNTAEREQFRFLCEQLKLTMKTQMIFVYLLVITILVVNSMLSS